MLTIENEFLSVKVNEMGGCLASIYDKTKNEECLYQPLENSWKGQDVFVFPMVARLVDGNYLYKGKTYEFKNHGLIRYMKGELHQVSKTECKVSFTQDEETLSRYPFLFEAESAYKLVGRKLIVTYKIKNNTDEDMPFMIGGHPAFKLPGEKKDDLFDLSGNYITFDKKVKLTRIVQDDTFSFNVGEEDFAETDRIDLTKEMFLKIDTYIFKADDFTTLTLHKKNGSCITMDKNTISYLALWSNNAWGDFVAIEPWNGLPDALPPEKEFTKKKGVNLLKPNQTYTFTYSVEIN